MAIDDLWYLKDRDPETKKPKRSKRYGRGNRWRVRWEDPVTGRTRTESFSKKVHAELYDNNIQADISRGHYVDPQAGRVLVADYFDKWRLLQAHHRPSTQEAIERMIRLHVKPVIGHRPIAQVLPETVQSWVVDRKAVLSPSTLRTIFHMVIHPVFKHAAVNRAIGRSPCVNITLPPLPDGMYDIPTAEQIQAVVAALDKRYRALPVLAASEGWRSGELFGVEETNVGFLARKISVAQQLSEVKHQLLIAPPKTKTSVRTNELATAAGEALSQHIKMFPPKETIMTDTTGKKPRERPVRLIFTGRQGQPIRRGKWSMEWNAACEAADLPPGMFTLRSLRHYFATVLIYGGKNVKTVQLAMGHADPTVTLKTYLGYWPDDERNGTRDLLDDALGSSFTDFLPAETA